MHIYFTIFVLCSLIYLRIRAIHRELLRYDQLASVRCERRAFGTMAMMLATLGVFFAPYMTIHVLSLNLPAASNYLHDSAVVYYMNVLPYLKFASDPIIYGLRMREVKVGFLLVIRGCCSLRQRVCLCRSQVEDDSLYEMTSLPVQCRRRHSYNDVQCHEQITARVRINEAVRF